MKRKVPPDDQQRVPDDIIFSELLTRIPVKNVFQCKCVSNGWRNMIRTPAFMEAYNARNPDHGGLFVIGREREYKSTSLVRFYYSSLHTEYTNNFVNILNVSMSGFVGHTKAVNGLVCLYSTKGVCLCNVSTGEIKQLPDFPGDEQRNRACNRKFKLVLLQDPVRKVNKVVKISRSRSSEYCNIIAFTVHETEEDTLDGCSGWKSLVATNRIPYRLWEHILSINGVLYLINPRHPIDASIEIFSVDLSQEKFHPIKPPRRKVERHSWMEPRFYALAEFRGKMSMFFRYNHREYIVYRLEDEEGNVWTKYEFIWPRGIPCYVCLFPVGSLPNGEILLATAGGGRSPGASPVYAYDHENRKFRTFTFGLLPWSVSLEEPSISEVLSFASRRILPWSL